MEEGSQAGAWICEKILGKGSYGIVGLWKHTGSGERLAVKKFEIKNSSQGSDTMVANLEERYRQEVIMMYEQIDNLHIVATKPTPQKLTLKFAEIRSNGTSNQRDSKYEPVEVSPLTSLPLLTMEFCDGGDLRQMLRRPENLSGLSENEVRTVLAHISDAITYLHGKSIIHRDIKPENILVKHSATSNNVVYKLSDLGFAKDISAQDSCKTILGTLPYLAPEIYCQKKYDYTVDYWSFGLIAFEITCGYRPFLPSESPAQWIPEVEKKSKDVITIYRTEDNKIEYSRDIPYNTHLSQLFKKCLVAWLASMLQFDPARRGKYVLTNDNGRTSPKDSNALVRLKNMLETKFLEVYTFSERLVFAIGRSVKVEHVKKWIERDTGTLMEDQLLLTADGKLAESEDLAINYFSNNNSLYLIPKQFLDVSSKVKLSKVLSTFLQPETSNGRKCPPVKIWLAATYFIRRQWERVQVLHTAANAFRLYYKRNHDDDLKNIVVEIDKRAASLNTLIELEQQLEDVENRSGRAELGDGSKSPATFKTEGDDLNTFLLEQYQKRQELLLPPPSKLEVLADIYKRMLKLYDRFKQEGVEKESEIMQSLRTTICEFMVLRELSINIAAASMKKVLERLPSENELKEKLQIILAKFNVLIDQVMCLRVSKHKVLLNISELDSKPQPDLFKDEQGKKVAQMSQSVIFEGATPDNTSLPSKRMVQSFCPGSNRNSFSPDLMELLQEAEWIQQEMDRVSMSTSLR